MSRDTWNPDHYLTFAGERGRPFIELVQRIAVEAPARVVDLGCGPGNLTNLLAARWPSAAIEGVDSSAKMIDAAIATGSTVDYRVQDIAAWAVDPGAPSSDVVIANAALQWVPGHLDLLPHLVDRINQGGWLALQVPGNFAEPSHALLHELAAEPRYVEHAASVARPAAHDPRTYLDRLVELGCAVDAWETTYLHVLEGEDAVFDWISATGARPTLNALPGDLRADFVATYKARLRAAYPARDGQVVLPFRRVFVIARTPVEQGGPR